MIALFCYKAGKFRFQCAFGLIMTPTLPDLKQRIQALLASPSVSSAESRWNMSNRPVIELLAGWFEQLGFDCRIQELADGKANLIACYGTGSGGLVLSGHTDTVPFDEKRWQFDPLSLTEADNRFYGLGSADMKSFFALIIEAVLPLLQSDFKHPLIVLATADEESSMNGARALSEGDFNNPRAAIIGEPTGLKPVYMHKGIMMQRLVVTGQSGHSSNPALGHNALDAMHDMLTELKALRTEWQIKHQDTAFTVNYPTMNFGCIHGGDNPNRICNSCELHFDFRALPGMSSDIVTNAILERLSPIAEQHNVAMQFEPLFAPVEPFAEEKDSELVTLAEKLSGHEAQAVAFGTEAPFLKKLGMQTIVMGPGHIDQAHQPDEYVSLEQITPGVSLLRQFIQHYCLNR